MVYFFFKILFRGRKDPLVFNIGLFDFTANTVSKKFEPFVKSNDTFCDEVNGVSSSQMPRESSQCRLLSLRLLKMI
jgi:hypothetical protein